jgi:hypothetical protein
MKKKKGLWICSAIALIVLTILYSYNFDTDWRMFIAGGIFVGIMERIKR